MPGIFDFADLDLPFLDLGKRFLKSLEDEAAETFLKALFFLLKVKFTIDPAFRRNIENFKGLYQFKSKDDGLAVLLEFDDGDISFREGLSDDATVTVIFKDGRSLIGFLLSQKKDVFRSLLNNEINVSGNMNYIYKLGYMANHLQLELTHNLP